MLTRRMHEGSLTQQRVDVLLRLFRRDRRGFMVVPLDDAIMAEASQLLRSRPAHVRLRTLDAIQLASAQRAFADARSRGFTTGSFITADQHLLAAAVWAGLPVLNPEDYA